MNKRERIIELATQIAIFRAKLKTMESELDSLLPREETSKPVKPATVGGGITARVLAFFTANKETAWSASDLAPHIGVSRDKINSLRSTLLRLVSEKKIEKTGIGKFAAKREGSATNVAA